MIGSLDRNCKEATVIGGGVSGLIAAYYLTKSGYHVTIYEASERWGGLISTVRTRWGLCEAAANSLVATKALRDMCRDIECPLVELHPEARAKYIYRARSMRRWPLTFVETCQLVWRVLTVRAAGDTALSARDFALRHLGPAGADYLIEPMVRGIYGASGDQLNLSLALPFLSVPKGQSVFTSQFLRKKKTGEKRIIVAPENGMQSFVEALVNYLRKRPQQVTMLLNVKVKELPENTKNVILCLPADETARLLFPACLDTSRAFSAIKYTSMVSASVFLRREAFASPPCGLGVLFPAVEDQGPVLGVLFSSSSFPTRIENPDEVVALTFMMKGDASTQNPDAVQIVVTTTLKQLFSVSSDAILHAEVFRWPRAIPIYGTEVATAIETAKEKWCATPGRVIFGNIAGEVSLRGMIASAQSAFA